MIHFKTQIWNRIKSDYTKWWSGELKRPLIVARVHGYEPDSKEPSIPSRYVTACYGSDVSAEQIVDRWDYDLSCMRFFGDGFPHIFPHFGAGSVAAFVGAKADCTEETVWFHPSQKQPIQDIEWKFDPNNYWYNRVKDIYKAGVERWQGSVVMAMTDLGGILDILSTFRPSEELLMDLYDAPEQVKRLTWNAFDLWWQYYEEFNSIFKSVAPGYSTWDGLFSAAPYYVLQSDFCYMISVDMFNEFVKPELAKSCAKLGNSIYHLDGVGQLNHLDSLLEIEELDAVQWIPGAGQPDVDEWPEVFKKIKNAGKRMQILAYEYGQNFEKFHRIVDQLGSPEGLAFMVYADVSKEDNVLKLLDQYNVPVGDSECELID